MVSLSEEYAMSLSDHAANFPRVFQHLLRQKQLVDVTLVADGIFIDAHRLVLSAVSPYFRQMFTQMPENQRTFVFLMGVPIAILEDIITFIYHGEVSVKQENLEQFLQTIKSLGLSDTNCSQSKPDLASSSNVAPLTPSYFSSGLQYQTSQTFRIQTPGRNILMPTYDCSEYDSMDNRPIMLNTHSEQNGNHCQNSEATVGRDDFGYDVSSVDGSLYLTRETGATSEQWPFENENLVQKDNSTEAKAPASKRHRTNDLVDYNIEADIRTNAYGRENLFYKNYKYCRNGVHGLKQRWRCTKHSSNTKCGATVNTMQINGIVMMKVLHAEHSH